MINSALRADSTTHSVHSLAISVSDSVHKKVPERCRPQCATRSISINPGECRSCSVNILTGILLLTRLTARLRFLPAVVCASFNRRSMDYTLTFRNCSRSAGFRLRCPCFSIAGISWGSNALRRLPHNRSEASQRTIRAC